LDDYLKTRKGAHRKGWLLHTYRAASKWNSYFKENIGGPRGGTELQGGVRNSYAEVICKIAC